MKKKIINLLGWIIVAPLGVYLAVSFFWLLFIENPGVLWTFLGFVFFVFIVGIGLEGEKD